MNNTGSQLIIYYNQLTAGIFMIKIINKDYDSYNRKPYMRHRKKLIASIICVCGLTGSYH